MTVHVFDAERKRRFSAWCMNDAYISGTNRAYEKDEPVPPRHTYLDDE